MSRTGLMSVRLTASFSCDLDLTFILLLTLSIVILAERSLTRSKKSGFENVIVRSSTLMSVISSLALTSTVLIMSVRHVSLFFAKPRYVKPAGTLRRTEKARATKK